MIYCITIWFQSLNKLVNQSHIVCLLRERYANLSSVVYVLGQQLLATYLLNFRLYDKTLELPGII